jgi:hypothetical protein
VTGAWEASITTPTGPFIRTIVLSQSQAQVVATASPSLVPPGRSGIGSVSNPRALSVFEVELTAPTGASTVNMSFVGDISSSLSTWSGTATGLPICPCAFTATRR